MYINAKYFHVFSIYRPEGTNRVSPAWLHALDQWYSTWGTINPQDKRNSLGGVGENFLRVCYGRKDFGLTLMIDKMCNNIILLC
jgi:hypothetical protein